MSWRRTIAWVRERFVLTTQEKKMVAFVAAMFLLGFATKEYRARHPRLPPPPAVEEQPRVKKSTTPRPKKQKAPPKPGATPTRAPAADDAE